MDNKEINQEVKDEVKAELNAEVNSSNNSKLNNILIICIFILIVAIVGVVLFFVLKKDKPNNDSKNALSEEKIYLENKINLDNKHIFEGHYDILSINIYESGFYKKDNKMDIYIDGNHYTSYEIEDKQIFRMHLTEGTHIYSVTFYDKNGNYGTKAETITYNAIESEAEKLILSVCVHSLVEGYDNAQELSKEQLLSGLCHYLSTINYLSYGDNQFNDGWYKISKEDIEYYIKDIFNIEYKNHSKTTDEDLLKYENGVYYYHDWGGDFFRDPVVLEIKEIKKINDKTYNVSFEYEWGYGIEEDMPDGTWVSRIEKPDFRGTAVIKLDGNNYYLASFSQQHIDEI